MAKNVISRNPILLSIALAIVIFVIYSKEYAFMVIPIGILAWVGIGAFIPLANLPVNQMFNLNKGDSYMPWISLKRGVKVKPHSTNNSNGDRFKAIVNQALLQ